MFEKDGFNLYKGHIKPTLFEIPTRVDLLIEGFSNYDEYTIKQKRKIIQRYIFKLYYLKVSHWNRIFPNIKLQNPTEEETVKELFNGVEGYYNGFKEIMEFRIRFDSILGSKILKIINKKEIAEQLPKKFRIKTMFMAPNDKLDEFLCEITRLVHLKFYETDIINRYLNELPKLIMEDLEVHKY